MALEYSYVNIQGYLGNASLLNGQHDVGILAFFVPNGQTPSTVNYVDAESGIALQTEVSIVAHESGSASSSSITTTTVASITYAGTGFANTPCAPSSATSGQSGTFALVCTNLGLIVVQLSSSATVATTVANFVSLTQSGFYSDLVWHRIVPGFVIQSGDPTTKNGSGDRSAWGSGSSGTTIPLQIDPAEPNIVGSIAMASPSGGLASSQFFINLANNTGLDGSYAVFGQVVSGMSVVDAIARQPIITNTCPNGSECDQPVDPSEAYIVSVMIQNSAQVAVTGQDLVAADNEATGTTTTFACNVAGAVNGITVTNTGTAATTVTGMTITWAGAVNSLTPSTACTVAAAGNAGATTNGNPISLIIPVTNKLTVNAVKGQTYTGTVTLGNGDVLLFTGTFQ